MSLFLVQELVDGEALAEEMQSKRYREGEVLDLLEAQLHILADLAAEDERMVSLERDGVSAGMCDRGCKRFPGHRIDSTARLRQGSFERPH